MVHRAVFKEGPAHFQQFFETREEQATHWTRAAARRERHGKQLKPLPGAYCPELRRRSALGLITVYNLLPARVVAQTSVKSFQTELQNELKERAARDEENWQTTYSPRTPWWCHPLR